MINAEKLTEIKDIIETIEPEIWEIIGDEYVTGLDVDIDVSDGGISHAHADYVVATPPAVVLRLIELLELSRSDTKTVFEVMRGANERLKAEAIEMKTRNTNVVALEKELKKERRFNEILTEEFTEAQARLKAVSELHRPLDGSFGESTVISCEGCAHAGLDETASAWPCPTARALGLLSKNEFETSRSHC